VPFASRNQHRVTFETEATDSGDSKRDIRDSLGRAVAASGEDVLDGMTNSLRPLWADRTKPSGSTLKPPGSVHSSLGQLVEELFLIASHGVP
jgi:hypothetical protein